MNLSRNTTKRPISDDITIHEETFPAAEKILSDIENILRKDPELRSFEIIPIQDNENKSPVYHEEHSLGLASWCVQPLYCHTYSRLVELRRNDYRRQEPSAISRWLMGALLLNPDVTTFWNMKRELVRNGRLDALEELRFSSLILNYKAKCFDAFAYRRWLVRYLLVGSVASGSEIENLLTREIDVAGISADRYANNYHAWSHREYAMNIWEENMTEASYARILKIEWENSRKWCSRHVSDHSGLAYRQFILKRLLFERQSDKNHDEVVRINEIEERREFVERLVLSPETTDSWEYLNFLHSSNSPKCSKVDYDRTLIALSFWAEDCKHNENDIFSFPGHEALWYHRRFLAYALLAIENSYRRHCAYKIEHYTKKCSRNLDEKSSKSRIDAPEASHVGPLLRAFHRNNEIIVDASRNFSDVQSLGDKFLKYVGELFRTDLTSKQPEDR